MVELAISYFSESSKTCFFSFSWSCQESELTGPVFLFISLVLCPGLSQNRLFKFLQGRDGAKSLCSAVGIPQIRFAEVLIRLTMATG